VTALPRVRASELVGRGWLNTGGRTLSLAELRGRCVVLDFWTFCCVNCLHVLDELRALESRFGDEFVVVGVHSPKFAHEADPDALAAAVERYEVRHPVLDDPTLLTWQAYTARAWPTLVVIDPEGYVVAHLAGEGHGAALAALVEHLVEEHAAKGTLRRGAGPYVPPPPSAGTLRFPAKAVPLPGGSLLVADAGHHSLAELAPDGATLVRRIGSGSRGWADGGPDEARFAEPNGLALMPRELAGFDYDVVVADTANHLLRGVRLADGAVTTLAGTGEQYLVGAPDNVSPWEDGSAPDDRTGLWYHGDPRRVRLSSPWDIVWYQPWAAFAVAMAGNHSLWAFDPHEGSITHVMGTMNEGLVDGLAGNGWSGPAGSDAAAWFAQPSGLAVDDAHRLWVADSETSALRVVTGGLADARVRTVVGAGLFDFGHRDGPADEARLQHPLGVAVAPDGAILVADTYNGAVRRYDEPADDLWVDKAAPGAVKSTHTGGGGSAGSGTAGGGPASADEGRAGAAGNGRTGAAGEEPVDAGPAVAVGADRAAAGHAGAVGTGSVSTVAEGLAEPSGLVVGGDQVLVVESAAHRITRLALSGTSNAAAVDRGVHTTQRPVTELAPGDVDLVVAFTPAPGQQADDRYGPSTSLSVSSSPPELLADGAGDGTPLTRRLRLNPAVGSGVLHVGARAASCDADPAVEFPACHLASQDWGIPVRLAPGAPTTLTLPLFG
jgi:thiol-disulfide isomerase/thioredoxin